jgi:hypothetical protein
MQQVRRGRSTIASASPFVVGLVVRRGVGKGAWEKV